MEIASKPSELMDNQRDELGIHRQQDIVEVYDATQNLYLSTEESCHAPHAKESQRNSELDMFERASDLFMSMSIHGEFNKAKIFNLAGEAAKELAQMAMEKEPLWCFVEEEGKYVLNEVEYKRRYSHAFDQTQDSILTFMMNTSKENIDLNIESILRDDDDWYNDIYHRDFGHSCFQIEASKEIGFFLMAPLDLVHLLIDVDGWSVIFSNMVSNAKRIGVLSTGHELGNPNGYLQVIRAEYHICSPLVETRECYFLRHCKQLDYNVWLVVDVSLENIFPDSIMKCIRRPSGCLIKGLDNGYTMVTWIEHIQVVSQPLHLFRPLVTSGFVLGARRYLGTLVRRHDRLKTLNNIQVEGGKASLLKLTDRMTRSYFSCLCSSSETIWKPLPVSGGEDIMVTTKFNDDNDLGSPFGLSIVVAATIWLPKRPSIVFDFLRHGELRNKWDLLCQNQKTQETKLVTTGSDQRNCVSLISIQGSPSIYYLQESHTDLTGFYVTYAPIDIYAINKVLDGGETNDVQILSSGFSIFPDCPKINEEESSGSIFTIGFHVPDQDSLTPDYVSPKQVSVLHMIMKETISKIRVAMI